MKILDNCYFTFCEMRTLIDKSLITISTNGLKMHDLIQQKIGRKIVCQQSLKDSSKHSRLWRHDDVYDVLEKNMVRGKKK